MASFFYSGVAGASGTSFSSSRPTSPNSSNLREKVTLGNKTLDKVRATLTPPYLPVCTIWCVMSIKQNSGQGMCHTNISTQTCVYNLMCHVNNALNVTSSCTKNFRSLAVLIQMKINFYQCIHFVIFRSAVCIKVHVLYLTHFLMLCGK